MNVEVGADNPGVQGPEVPMAGLLTRVSLGWFLMHQGWGKVVLDWNEGLGAFYRSESFQGRNPVWLPDLIAAPYGYALPLAEFVFGALLIIGLFTRVTAAASAIIFISIAVALLNGGGFIPRHALMVFIPLAIYFMLTGPGRFSTDAFLANRRKGERAGPRTREKPAVTAG